MARLLPFRAVRPRPDLAAAVASVPYDVVETDEARRLAAGNPVSFLHVVRAEIDLPEDTDPHAAEVYEQAAATFRRFLADGVLARDEEASLFVYRQVMDGHAQHGLVGLAPVADYDEGRIKKHERTRPDKVEDRTRHTLEVGAHCGSVFLTYRGRQAIDRLVAAETARPSLADFTATDGVRHSVWRAAATAELVREMAAVPALYIADGHHRCASASRAAAELRATLEAPTGEEEHERFLVVAFPAAELRILGYNRVVHDLAGATPEAFLGRLGETMEVTPGSASEASERGTFAVYLAGAWYRLRAPRARIDDPDPVARLDAAILQDLVLAPLLGIDDPRTSERVDFVGGIRGSAELARRVDRRGEGVAFALHPLAVEELMAVADAGRVLPPKSTWFEPKLRSGLLVHEIREVP